MTKPKMTHDKAIVVLELDLYKLFQYLHRDYNEALTIAIEALKREQLLGIGESKPENKEQNVPEAQV